MSDQSTQQPQQTTPQPTPASDRIHLLVRNRKQVLFDGDAKALTSKNDSGVFDVLPEHANFISVLKESITIHTLDGKKQDIPLHNGVIKVKDRGIRCYIDLLTAEAQK